MPHLDHLDSAARRKLGAFEAWRAFSFECVEGGYIVIGAVPVEIYTRGPKKGRPKRWKGAGTKVLLTESEVAQEIRRYIEATGNCPDCFGRKETFRSWSKVAGLVLGPCQTCNATGKAPRP